MLNEFIRAFVLIFVAEMGDKSQIIAMTFATVYKLKDVLLGVSLGVVANHAIAIILGSFISMVIPTTYIHIIAGFLFIIFGLNSLNVEEEEELESKKQFSPVLTVAIAFFIGELGDKTQLATMALAAEAINPLVVLLGTSLAMIATSLLGIFIGIKVGEKIPEVSVKIISSLVFLGFGIVRVLSSIEIANINIWIIGLVIIGLVSMEVYLIRRLLKSTYRPKKEASQALYEMTKLLKRTIDSICLTEHQCGTCSGIGCLVGYIKYILNESRKTGEYFDSLHVDTDKLIKKNFDRKKVLEALILILKDYNENSWIQNEEFVVNKIKSSLEVMLFNSKIHSNNTKQYISKVKSYNKVIGAIIEENI